MQVTVDRDFCTGCGVCAEVAPAVFAMVGDIAVVKVRTVAERDEPGVREAAAICPVDAIDLPVDALDEV